MPSARRNRFAHAWRMTAQGRRGALMATVRVADGRLYARRSKCAARVGRRRHAPRLESARKRNSRRRTIRARRGFGRSGIIACRVRVLLMGIRAPSRDGRHTKGFAALCRIPEAVLSIRRVGVERVWEGSSRPAGRWAPGGSAWTARMRPAQRREEDRF